MRLLPFLLMLGACVPTGHLNREQASTPTFDPIIFFSGRTQGQGSLKVMNKHRQPTRVDGQGSVAADGSVLLEQEVTQGDRPSTQRTWHLRRVAPDRYQGTLTDAVGPVRGDVSGNLLHLSFVMKSGMRAQQWLYLEPGGQVVHNRMIVSKFGVAVARLDETIRRLPNSGDHSF